MRPPGADHARGIPRPCRAEQRMVNGSSPRHRFHGIGILHAMRNVKLPFHAGSRMLLHAFTYSPLLLAGAFPTGAGRRPGLLPRNRPCAPVNRPGGGLPAPRRGLSPEPPRRRVPGELGAFGRGRTEGRRLPRNRRKAPQTALAGLPRNRPGAAFPAGRGETKRPRHCRNSLTLPTANA